MVEAGEFFYDVTKDYYNKKEERVKKLTELWKTGEKDKLFAFLVDLKKEIEKLENKILGGDGKIRDIEEKIKNNYKLAKTEKTKGAIIFGLQEWELEMEMWIKRKQMEYYLALTCATWINNSFGVIPRP